MGDQRLGGYGVRRRTRTHEPTRLSALTTRATATDAQASMKLKTDGNYLVSTAKHSEAVEKYTR